MCSVKIDRMWVRLQTLTIPKIPVRIMGDRYGIHPTIMPTLISITEVMITDAVTRMVSVVSCNLTRKYELSTPQTQPLEWGLSALFPASGLSQSKIVTLRGPFEGQDLQESKHEERNYPDFFPSGHLELWDDVDWYNQQVEVWTDIVDRHNISQSLILGTSGGSKGHKTAFSVPRTADDNGDQHRSQVEETSDDNAKVNEVPRFLVDGEETKVKQEKRKLCHADSWWKSSCEVDDFLKVEIEFSAASSQEVSLVISCKHTWTKLSVKSLTCRSHWCTPRPLWSAINW